MKDSIRSKWVILLLLMTAAVYFPSSASGDENLGIYGLKGYAYLYSPLVADGLHMQIGAMFSRFKDDNLFRSDNLNCRDGDIWAFPVSLTYGDGNWWEVSAATHWESWENTHEYWKDKDVDTDQTGIGDVFLGGKLRLLGQDRGMPLDLSVMAYTLLPSGNRDKAIGDLYLYNPTDEDDTSYGVNVLLGRQWKRSYFGANIGLNYVDTDVEHIEDKTIFWGLVFEYQVSEHFAAYTEFINTENKNRENYPTTSVCYDEDTDEDIRELGFGMVWVKGGWGFKLHGGAGLTPTSPDFRVMTSINRSFSF
jgi:hypothetical protein